MLADIKAAGGYILAVAVVGQNTTFAAASRPCIAVRAAFSAFSQEKLRTSRADQAIGASVSLGVLEAWLIVPAMDVDPSFLVGANALESPPALSLALGKRALCHASTGLVEVAPRSTAGDHHIPLARTFLTPSGAFLTRKERKILRTSSGLGMRPRMWPPFLYSATPKSQYLHAWSFISRLTGVGPLYVFMDAVRVRI